MRLDEKRVVIIGGSSGIGLETARLARGRGGVRHHRREIRGPAATGGREPGSPTRRLGKTPTDRLRCVVADIAEESSVRSLFDGETQVDHLFLPAGELRPGAADVLGVRPGMAAVDPRDPPPRRGPGHTPGEAQDAGRLHHLDVRPLLDPPRGRRGDGGGGRRRCGGDDPGPGARPGPDPRQRRGPRADRDATLGRLRHASRGDRRAGGQTAGRPDRSARGGGRGGRSSS